jgi:hypothetical protein
MADPLAELTALNLIQHLQVGETWFSSSKRQLNPLTCDPIRYWSQSDEDTITLRILDRIGMSSPGTFIEFGVGDGRENNTLVLLAHGWRGVWIGGQDIIFEPAENGRLEFKKSWITLDNIKPTTDELIQKRNLNPVDLVSLDLDGNDLHFTKHLLQGGLRPKVWIAEYNARFPVGVKWTVPYDATHTWVGDDYWGASFSSFCKLFEEYEYFPVACSILGANIFFVQKQYGSKFADVTNDIHQIYQPPLHYLVPKWGHRASAKTLRLLTENQPC